MKYAIIETGSKQYRVEEGTQLEVERLSGKEGTEVKLSNVLLLRDGRKTEIGQPKVKGVTVICEVVKHLRGPKITVFKFKRRKDTRRKIGHRQELTRLRVKEIKST